MGTSQSTRRVQYQNFINTAKEKLRDLKLDCHLGVYNVYRTDWYTDTQLQCVIFERNFFVAGYETRAVAFKGGYIRNEGDSGPINEVYHHAGGKDKQNIVAKGERGYKWNFEAVEVSADEEIHIRQVLREVIAEYEDKK